MVGVFEVRCPLQLHLCPSLQCVMASLPGLQLLINMQISCLIVLPVNCQKVAKVSAITARTQSDILSFKKVLRTVQNQNEFSIIQ